MLDKVLNWLFKREEETAPISVSHLKRENDAEVLFRKRSIELKLTQDERNRLRRKVDSISQKVKVVSHD